MYPAQFHVPILTWWKSNWSWFLIRCTVCFPPHRRHNMCKASSPTKKCLKPFLPAGCYCVKIQMSMKILEFCAPGQKVSGQLCKFWSCLQWAGCVYLLTDWWCCGVSPGFQLISSPAPPSVPNMATSGKARCESQGGWAPHGCNTRVLKWLWVSSCSKHQLKCVSLPC